MKIRLTDDEIRCRVVAGEVADLLSGSTLVCRLIPEATITLCLGDTSTFEATESGWRITLDRSAVRDMDELIGYRLADIAASDSAPRLILEIDRPKRWSTSDRSKGGQASGRFVPASPQESSG
jgi:hypothetical protein